MFNDPALHSSTLQLQAAFAQWRTILKRRGGPAVTDDVVLELLAQAVAAHVAEDTKRAKAVAAHLEAERLPANVVSLDQRRANADGLTKEAVLGAAPFGSIRLDGPDDAERLHRLAHATGKSRDTLLAEAFRRGLIELEKEAGSDRL